MSDPVDPQPDCAHVEHRLCIGFPEYDYRDTWCGRRADPGAFESRWEPCPTLQVGVTSAVYEPESNRVELTVEPVEDGETP